MVPRALLLVVVGVVFAAGNPALGSAAKQKQRLEDVKKRRRLEPLLLASVTALSIGLAATGVGLTFWVAHERASRELSDTGSPGPLGFVEAKWSTDLEARTRRAHAYGVVFPAAMALSAACYVAGTTMIIVGTRRRKSPRPTTSLSPLLLPGGGGPSLMVSF